MKTIKKFAISIGLSTPSGMILGEYNIILLNEETFNGYIERKFEVKNNNTGATQSVTQYQITNWDSTGKLTNPQTILLVIEEMYRTQRKRGNTSIVVHCSDTVGRSAMFCAAATTINKCKTEGVIDVFQVLKSQRIQKPGSVQTVDRIIPDYFMIYASQFYDKDENDDVNDTIDALWCQSANNGTNIGVWYYPNGTEVPLFDGLFGNLSAPSPVYSKRFSGQIALARRGGLSGYEGLYKCIIPDENGVDQTLVVGAYTNTGYNNNDGPDADPTMQFSLLSTSRLATPPVFSLSFNVSDGPPTNVSCLVNGNGISTELSRVIVNGSGSVTRVTVTVRLREAGNYQCTVFNIRVTDGPISGNSHPNAASNTSSLSISGKLINYYYSYQKSLLTLSVFNTPTGLTATRLSTGLAHVRLSWSTVSGATGYEVYYQLSSNTPVSESNTSYTTVNITSGLNQESTYTFYVVSYGSASLPSGNASVMLTINDPVVSDFMAMVDLITNSTITLTWSPPTAVVPNSYNIVRDCRRVCEPSTTGSSETSVSSPHTSTGILPYSQCAFDLIGVYDIKINLITNYSAETLTATPTAPVGDIIFSSVESVSMTVSWDEVPCNGRNGPITGYYLTYTNITSNTSYTVNITGEDNRMYNLTGLVPYTNYTVSIIPYNYNMNGPARQEIQLTAESIPGVTSNLVYAKNPDAISIVWNPPTIPNGIITVYEIRYRESTSTGPYNITNTTNTYYSIVGLIPNTSYTIEVRAYTSIGPGEWTDREYTTIEIRTPMLPTTDGSSMTIIFIAAGAIVPLLLIVIIIVITIVVVLISNRRYSRGNLQYCKGAYTPVIEEFPNDMTSEEGRQVLFKVKVKVRGNSKPSFNWYHNGEPVTDDYAHELRGDGSLLLVSVEEKHKGTYRFVANNDAGTVSQQVVLTVAVEGSDESRLLHGDSSSAKIDMIPVDKFGEFVANGHAKGNEGFRNQFGMLDSGESDHTVTVGLTPSNKLLNRFANIVVYDDNRITLRPMPGHKDCTNEYINACFIKDYSNQYQYIATQGPVSNTLVDFWQLIWQEKSTIIVMITNIIEEGKVKCQQYWPNSDTKDYGPFSVTLREHPDYINAVFINGYKEKKAFIIAESPMFNTARNFWKMIDDRNVTAIVMLCQENKNNQEVCYQYWSNRKLGEYNISLLNEEIHNAGYIERKIEVTNDNKAGDKQQVKQYQITNWDSTGKLTNPQTILLVIEEMYRTQRKRGNTSIVIHCSDTVGRSGVFCAAATTINKCKTEGVIDVFQVLKSQRIQKPGSVQTVQQYQGIFQIVLTYLDSFETYSNFTT
uniref:protein-tyrosine-phosphatase n=1 Tax=Amphimedon queenslandica TaxID=400682 RepID=A0A1X7TV44_AMPQE